jgi:hypothetical protein
MEHPLLIGATMEGKYTKASAVVGFVALAITLWQVIPGSTKNYSGEWSMISEIENAQMTTYVGMKIEWVLHLTQSGNNVQGMAEKIAVNAEKLDFRSRTTLQLKGTLDGNKFTISYIENGSRRETNGILTGEFKGNKFSGTFSSTASDSKGIISGNKIN